MIEENVKKVKELDESFLQSLFKDWDRTQQLDPFDILFYGRSGNVTAILRRIDGECGVLKLLTLHCGISTKEKSNDTGIEELYYVDPDDGPLIGQGTYQSTYGTCKYSSTDITIREIYTSNKISSYIVFYDV